MKGPKQKLLRPLSEPEAAVVQLKFVGMQRRGMRISAIRSCVWKEVRRA